MKKILFLLLTFAVVLTSCDPKDVPDNKGKLDPNATILLRPAKGVQLRSANPDHLTALQIVEQTKSMAFYSRYFDNKYTDEPQPLFRGFSDPQRDYQTPALKMWASDIISEDANAQPYYQREFIEGFDFILTKGENADTVAYIPNSVLANARGLVKAAYDAGDFAECYRLFHEVFTFIPITGAEWRALKAANQN